MWWTVVFPHWHVEIARRLSSLSPNHLPVCLLAAPGNRRAQCLPCCGGHLPGVFCMGSSHHPHAHGKPGYIQAPPPRTSPPACGVFTRLRSMSQRTDDRIPHQMRGWVSHLRGYMFADVCFQPLMDREIWKGHQTVALWANILCWKGFPGGPGCFVLSGYSTDDCQPCGWCTFTREQLYSQDSQNITDGKLASLSSFVLFFLCRKGRLS